MSNQKQSEEIEKAIRMGPKLAKVQGSPKTPQYSKSIKGALSYAKTLVNNNYFDEAFEIAMHLHDKHQNKIKQVAAIHCSRLFLYNNQQEKCVKLAKICLDHNVQPTLILAKIITQDLYRKKYLKEAKELILTFNKHNSPKVKEFNKELIILYRPETEFNTDTFKNEAIEHVKSELESYSPIQITEMASATKYCRALIKHKKFNETYEVFTYLCTEDLGLMKSDLCIEIATYFLKNQENKLAFKMATKLTDIHCAFKLKTLKTLIQVFKKYNLSNEINHIVKGINKEYNKYNTVNTKETKESTKTTAPEILNLNKLNYSELMDRELSSSHSNISSRETSFIDSKIVKKIRSYIDTILGKTFNEMEMNYTDPKSRSTFLIFIKRTFWKVIKKDHSSEVSYSYNQAIKAFNKNHNPGDESDFNNFLNFLKIPFELPDEEFSKVKVNFK